MKFTYLLLMFLFACSQGAKSPEGLVEMVVEDISNGKADRDYMLKHTTEDFFELSQNTTEHQWAQSVGLKRIHPAKVKILTKNCETSDNCKLTYSLKYVDHGSEVVIKKLAITKKIGEVWKLSDVSTLKTYIEDQSPIKVVE